MISMGLSAKQEKDDRFQLIKKEVVEMIKTQPLSLESKAFDKQAGASDVFQELGSEEKGAPKRKFSMDAALEEKICDLYDLFVDGLDDDAGPQIRKLYGELAELWPNGFMDKNGIKRAICRAKERRRALHSRHKEQEKMKRKKMFGPGLEDTVKVEGGLVALPHHTRERLACEPSSHPLTSSSSNKAVSITTATVRMPGPSMNTSNLDRPKPEKLKGSSNSSFEDTRVADGALTKKKVKRKPELELDETSNRSDKLTSQQGEERHKSLKPSGLPHKPNLQSTVPPSLEQSS